MLKRMKNRYLEVVMLHIGLNSHVWHLMDIVYVITGRII